MLDVLSDSIYTIDSRMKTVLHQICAFAAQMGEASAYYLECIHIHLQSDI